MSAGGVSGSDLPGPSSEPEKKREGKQKVERSSIRLGEIIDPEIGPMVRSVAGKKRQHSPEKNVSSELPEKKKVRSARKELLVLVEECFGKQIEDIEDIKEIAKQCFTFAAERLASFERLNWDEISKIHNLLYNSALKPFSLEAASGELDLINPHPVHVFKSLYESICPLYNYESFGEVVNARDNYLNDNPAVKNFLQIEPQDRDRILKIITEKIADFETTLNRSPIYTTRDLFGSHNIHPAYVLRNSDFQSTWIFKPTAVIHNGQVYEDSGGSYALSVSERVAYMVNFYHKFPIPATYLVEINGTIGSVQMYIPFAKICRDQNLKSLSDKNRERIHNLLIFDLLFSNRDRHADKILMNGKEEIFGIDHGDCMSAGGKSEILMDYLNKVIPYLLEPFTDDSAILFSKETIERYKIIMEAAGLSQISINWMEHAGEKMQDCYTKHDKIKFLAEKLIQDFELEN